MTMPLRLRQRELDAISEHGAREYPNECCGILLGSTKGADKDVHEVVPLANLHRCPERARQLMPLEDPMRESARNRYLLDPSEQLRIEKQARARGLQVLGYYHSHPDHGTQPSTYDRDHAWPGYSYLIVSVEGGKAKDVTSWVLPDEDAQFESEPIVIMTQ